MKKKSMVKIQTVKRINYFWILLYTAIQECICLACKRIPSAKIKI
jgi:hypothetical protein